MREKRIQIDDNCEGTGTFSPITEIKDGVFHFKWIEKLTVPMINFYRKNQITHECHLNCLFNNQMEG